MSDIVNSELVRIGPSSIHGTGVFASTDIPRGVRVLEYVGERISKEESNVRCEADNWYIFALDDEFDMDGKVDWNPARYINHSCQPNCEAENLDGHIWIMAVRDIKAGD